jgi:aspartyl protease family protein
VPSRGPAWLWLAVAAVGVVALVLALNGRFPGTLDEEGGLPRVLYLLCWLLVAGSGVVLAIRREPLKQLRNAAIWLGLGLALVIGYSFKDELGSRLLGELMPQRGVANADGSVTFRAGEDGHFHVEAPACACWSTPAPAASCCRLPMPAASASLPPASTSDTSRKPPTVR